MGPVAMETRGLTKLYGSAVGIEDVTFEVTSGEAFGFLGPNGAGKTTTIRTLLGLLHPTSGSASLLGLDSRRDGLAIRAQAGNLPGDFSYDRRLTGRELVEFLAELRGLPDLGRAETLAERFRADLDRPLGELSRGNRQKIGLIQAFFHEPRLIVLDEPTSGLDPLMQEEFLALVGEERAAGRTLFISSHELDEVERACDRVGIVRAGRLVAVEDVARLRAEARRRVSIEFAEPAEPEEFASLPGVSDVSAEGRRVAFRVAGELDAVIKAAARHRVTDIEVTKPSLEELFVGYYGEEG